MTTLRDRRLSAPATLLLSLAAGCATSTSRIPFDPIPMVQASGIVNDNLAKIDSTLKASGTVDGYFTSTNGKKRSYHVDGTLFYLAPRHLRFDLKKFGDRLLLLGSNDELYWYYSKEDDTYRCGRHDAPEDWPPDIPIRPDQIGDALGLRMIPAYGSRPGLLQRVVDDYQQLLFIEHDETSGVTLGKEYWLDRYAPQLVRRVVFRNAEGVVEMHSTMDDYRRQSPSDPWLPYVITVTWPATETRMRFRIARWTPLPEITSGGIQFATPRACQRLGID